MNLKYYHYWNLLTNKPSNPLDKETAKVKHEELEPYVVTVWMEDDIRYVIQMAFNIYHCSVFHYKQGKRIMDESYQIHEDKLFLRERVLWDTENTTRIVYLYELNGEYYTQKTDQQGKLIDEAEGIIEISSHFKDLVQFDQYGSILPISKIK